MSDKVALATLILIIIVVAVFIVGVVVTILRWLMYDYANDGLRIWEVVDGGRVILVSARDRYDAIALCQEKYGDDMGSIVVSEVPAFLCIPLVACGVTPNPEVRTAKEWSENGRGIIHVQEAKDPKDLLGGA